MRTCHSSDVHLGQVPGLEDDDGETIDGGSVAERHQHLTAACRLHLSNTQRATQRRSTQCNTASTCTAVRCEQWEGRRGVRMECQFKQISLIILRGVAVTNEPMAIRQ